MSVSHLGKNIESLKAAKKCTKTQDIYDSHEIEVNLDN